MSFSEDKVNRVSEFLQKHMRTRNIECMTADQCADLLAKAKILPNNVGPKPGFNFRQMLRDGRDGRIPLVTGATQKRPGARWHICRVDRNKMQKPAKLIIERGSGTKLITPLDEDICGRLWRFEKQYWRGKKEPSVESWRSLMPEIFDSFLKSKGF